MNHHTLQDKALLQGGRYRIVETLGQGGFGITYLAIQSGLERKVAIKEFFMKEFCERDEATSYVTLGTESSRETVNRFREKFLKEARNIARLNHPNIIRIFDVFEENGTAYYVMEYCENGSLADKVKQQGCLTESEAIRYIHQVAEALDYIHRKKMNHLDVKPANILLNENDETVLIDFGLSKQYDASTGSQTSTTPIGISNGFAPIEQYRPGGVSEFSPQTDIYSLGATFYMLLTGVVPPSSTEVYEDGIPVEVLSSKGTSKNTIALINKAMEPRRKERYQTVGEFLDVLGDGDGLITPVKQNDLAQKVEKKPDQSVQSLQTEQIERVAKPKFLKEEDKEATMLISELMVEQSRIETGEAVDLGLSVKWCSHNLGASKPEDAGHYLAWGASIENFNTLGSDIDGTEYDDAFVMTNGQWRTPTRKQIKELMDKCRWSWTEYNGVAGCKVTGPSGKSIFLPAAGKCNNDNIYRSNEVGYYWSASKASAYKTAHYLYFNDVDSDLVYEPISTKRTIRPVCY